MKKIVGLVEEVTAIGEKRVRCKAKFDTGAYTTSIDRKLAKRLVLKKTGKKILVRSASNQKGIRRPIVKMKLEILGKTISANANLSNRAHSKQKVLIGRDVIFNNFIIDVSKSNNSPRADDLK